MHLVHPRPHRRLSSAGTDEFNFNAVLLADRLIEVFSYPNSRRRKANVHECLAGNLQILDLASGDKLDEGTEAFIVDSEWTASASKRLYLECDRKGAPTFALDFYKAGQAPGLDVTGTSSSPNKTSLVVLYEVAHNQIQRVGDSPQIRGRSLIAAPLRLARLIWSGLMQIYVARDTDEIADLKKVSKEDLQACDVYMMVCCLTNSA